MTRMCTIGKKIVTMFVMILSVLAISCANDSTDSSTSGEKIDLSGILKNHTGLNDDLSTDNSGLTGKITSLTWDNATKTFTSQADAITAIGTYDTDGAKMAVMSIMMNFSSSVNTDQFAAEPIVTEDVKPIAGGADGKWNIRLNAADGFQFDNGTKFYDYKVVILTQ